MSKNTYESMLKLLLGFMRERQQVFVNREAGKPKPWTDDDILLDSRFCNIYREQDKVTRWIADNWRAPNDSDPDLWFAMIIARFTNRIETMDMLGYPVPWDRIALQRWENAVMVAKREKKPFFNAAYVIPTGGNQYVGPKHETLAMIFTEMWKRRKELRPSEVFNKPLRGQLAGYCRTLVAERGFGTFMAGQVIADLKYATPLKGADDWWKFAVSGPGSRRGLNRVVCNPVDQRWKEDEWFIELNNLRGRVNQEFKSDTKKYRHMRPIHGQDMQNSLCEFDKYCRAFFGEGKPKQGYNGRG